MNRARARERSWVLFVASAVTLPLGGCSDPVDPPDVRDVPRDLGIDAVVGPDIVRPPSDTGAEGGCATGQTMCGNTCVDTQSDNSNCGTCRTSCPTGVGCAAGSCSCMAPRLACAGSCVEAQSDPMNCGRCGRVCPMGQMCVAGACTLRCTAPQTLCDRFGVLTCANLETDSMNCGVCGAACGMGYMCVTGRCQCFAPRTACGGVCIDVTTDPMNCGFCGNSCGVGGTCAGGMCTCATGGTRCGATCADLMTDGNHCGACGNACPRTQTCVGGRCTCPTARTPCGALCVDVMTDTNNCGMCGTTCPPSASCTAGACRCPGGGTACGGVCTNLDTDVNNCGACANSCGVGGACAMGRCTCAMGYMMCGAACTDVRFDRLNCGGCGTVCPGTQVCLMGMCSSAPPTRYMMMAGPATLAFVDACAAPGSTTVLAGSDDGSSPSSLPFPFRYWATNLAMGAGVTVSSNGHIFLNTTTGGASLSGSIPPGSYNGMIAAHWSDNYQRSGVCVATVGSAPNRRYVVEWNDCGYCCPATAGTNLTFEIILNEGTNIIDMIYQTMTGARGAGIGLTDLAPPNQLTGCPVGTPSCVPTAGQRIRFVPIP